MAERKTDLVKKKIIADYLMTESVNAAARMNHVAWATAKKYIDELDDIEKILEQKKDENTACIAAYMKSKQQTVCDILDVALRVLPEKLENAKSATEVTTAAGTLIDKWLTVGSGSGAGRDEDEGYGVILVPEVASDG